MTTPKTSRPPSKGRSAPVLTPAAQKRLLTWYRQGARALPWRRTRDPYAVWVSEIMLQQTVIKAVLSKYESFLERFPTVEDLAEADTEEVRRAVRGLGYYRRFAFLHKAAGVIAARRAETGGDGWPRTYKGWRELPGVGDYTAAAVSSIAFDVPAAVVDGNVERVFARLGDVHEPAGSPALKKAVTPWVQQSLDENHPGDFNQAVMELGQTVCRPLNPDCDACPLARNCLARKHQTTGEVPRPKERTEPVEVAMELWIHRSGRRVELRCRGADEKFLKQTWGFDTHVHGSSEGAAQPTGTKRYLGTIRHGITQHRITAQVYVVDRANPRRGKNVRRLPADQVEEHLVSNLDRKAWRLFAAESQKTGRLQKRG